MAVSAHNALLNKFFLQKIVFSELHKVQLHQTKISLSLHQKQELLLKKTGKLKLGVVRRHVKNTR